MTLLRASEHFHNKSCFGSISSRRRNSQQFVSISKNTHFTHCCFLYIFTGPRLGFERGALKKLHLIEMSLTAKLLFTHKICRAMVLIREVVGRGCTNRSASHPTFWNLFSIKIPYFLYSLSSVCPLKVNFLTVLNSSKGRTKASVHEKSPAIFLKVRARDSVFYATNKIVSHSGTKFYNPK